MDHQKISTRSKHVFIAEYIKFRHREEDEEGEKEGGEVSIPELDLSIPTQVGLIELTDLTLFILTPSQSEQNIAAKLDTVVC